MKSRLTRLAFRLLATLGGLVLFVTCTPFVNWYASVLAGPWNDPPGDVLILLGASTEGHGYIARDSYLRSVYAVLAWRSGGFRKVVICGRQPAPSMRDYLLYAGIPASAIVLEDQSGSTRENALFAARLLQGESGRLVLLTSDYHMFRATRVFRNAGLAIQPRPIPDARKRAVAYTQRWSAFLDLVQETVKIAYYTAQGWL